MSGGGTQMTNHSRRGRPTQPNRTAIATASDSVQTPKAVAKWVVEYFAPRGRILEPARGDGNFLCFLPRETEWCEIKSGRDFFQYDGHVDWILTNPPYSIYDLFLNKCFAVAENIVFVCPVAKALKSQKSLISVHWTFPHEVFKELLSFNVMLCESIAPPSLGSRNP